MTAKDKLLTRVRNLDLYALLGVEPDAEEKLIKKAYRKKSLIWQQILPGKKGEIFLQLSDALEVLSDEKIRRAYDKQAKLEKERRRTENQKISDQAKARKEEMALKKKEKAKLEKEKKIKAAKIIKRIDNKNTAIEFGDWEKHTKGIGSKLLSKMGFLPGKGLGKNLQGRSTVLESPGPGADRGREGLGANRECRGPEPVGGLGGSVARSGDQGTVSDRKGKFHQEMKRKNLMEIRKERREEAERMRLERERAREMARERARESRKERSIISVGRSYGTTSYTIRYVNCYPPPPPAAMQGDPGPPPPVSPP